MNKKPAELTNDELLKKERTMRGLLYAFAGVLILLFALVILSLFEKHFHGTNMMPFILLPILAVNLRAWQQLKEEIKKRGL